MKFTLTLFLCTFVTFSTSAQVNISEALVLKMQKVTKVSTAKELQNALNLIREASLLTPTENLTFEALRIAVLSFNLDPHQTAIVILTDSYIENKNLYKKVFKKFNFETASLLLKSFDDSERETLSGNG